MYNFQNGNLQNRFITNSKQQLQKEQQPQRSVQFVSEEVQNDLNGKFKLNHRALHSDASIYDENTTKASPIQQPSHLNSNLPVQQQYRQQQQQQQRQDYTIEEGKEKDRYEFVCEYLQKKEKTAILIFN